MNFPITTKSGFSLIEVLISIFILTLIGLTIYSFQDEVFSLHKIMSNNLTAQGEIRRALKSMSAEIRTASPSSLGTYTIVQTAPASFIFYSNIDSDFLKERVRYFIEGTTLKKGVTKPSGLPLTYNPVNETISELVHDIANAATSTFNYYDANYDGTTSPLAEPIDILRVRLVKITIIVDQDSTKSPGPITLTTQISMRNLKDNL